MLVGLAGLSFGRCDGREMGEEKSERLTADDADFADGEIEIWKCFGAVAEAINRLREWAGFRDFN